MRLALTIGCALLVACIDAPGKPARDAGAVTCDPFADGGCAPVQSCQLLATDAFGCATAGVLGDQAACSLSTPCVSGLTCAVPPSGERALCLALCQKDPDCPQDTGLEMCAVAIVEGGAPVLCQRMRPCEPLIVPTSCENSEKCSLLRLPGPFVCLAAGTLGDYQPCAHESDCAAGFACLQHTDTSRCSAFCGRDLDCPQTSGLELCLGRNHPESPPLLCERAVRCTPGGHDCPAGEACYLYRSSSPELSSLDGLCRMAGVLPLGAPCAALNDCAPGLACLAAATDAPATCRPVCSQDGTLACPPGQGCLPITLRFGACQ